MIFKNEIMEKLSKSLVEKNCVINDEVKSFVDGYNGPFCEVLKENYKIAQTEGIPLCQDTGIVEFFVFIGHEVRVEEPLVEILNEVVEIVYSQSPFRYSVVRDPLFERKNTQNNTPPIIHIFQTKGNNLEIRFLIKGGGSENLSRLYMLRPSSNIEDFKRVIIEHIKENGAKGCPPLHVGIGVGGTSDEAMILSKLALTKNFKERNIESRYASLEIELIKRLNELKIGFQGLGKGVSVFSVHIEAFPTHIATLPVGISTDCYLCRKGVIDIEDR
ncbi:MAG: fumarate hydratase [Defluviitoga tunisiensis]